MLLLISIAYAYIVLGFRASLQRQHMQIPCVGFSAATYSMAKVCKHHENNMHAACCISLRWYVSEK